MLRLVIATIIAIASLSTAGQGADPIKLDLNDIPFTIDSLEVPKGTAMKWQAAYDKYHGKTVILTTKIGSRRSKRDEVATYPAGLTRQEKVGIAHQNVTLFFTDAPEKELAEAAKKKTPITVIGKASVRNRRPLPDNNLQIQVEKIVTQEHSGKK